MQRRGRRQAKPEAPIASHATPSRSTAHHAAIEGTPSRTGRAVRPRAGGPRGHASLLWPGALGPCALRQGGWEMVRGARGTAARRRGCSRAPRSAHEARPGAAQRFASAATCQETSRRGSDGSNRRLLSVASYETVSQQRQSPRPVRGRGAMPYDHNWPSAGPAAARSSSSLSIGGRGGLRQPRAAARSSAPPCTRESPRRDGPSHATAGGDVNGCCCGGAWGKGAWVRLKRC